MQRLSLSVLLLIAYLFSSSSVLHAFVMQPMDDSMNSEESFSGCHESHGNHESSNTQQHDNDKDQKKDSNQDDTQDCYQKCFEKLNHVTWFYENTSDLDYPKHCPQLYTFLDSYSTSTITRVPHNTGPPPLLASTSTPPDYLGTTLLLL